MKYILLIIMLIVCDSCICCYNKPNMDKVLFNISAIKKSNSKFSIKVLIKNNDSNTIALLLNKEDTIANNRTFTEPWYLQIKLNDSIIIQTDNNKGGLLIDYIPPSESDYLKLKPNEEKIMFWEIDFKTLNIYDMYFFNGKNSNAPYGLYSFRLYYEDDLKYYTCAIKTMSSNQIEIEYKD